MPRKPNSSRRDFIKKSSMFSLGVTVLGANSIPALGKPSALPNNLENSILGHGKHRYKLVSGWGSKHATNHPVDDCHEMAITQNQHIYMFGTETRNNMLVYNKDGKILDSWGTQFKGGHGCSVFKDGNTEYLFLTDTSARAWYKTTLKGDILQTFSAPMETGLYKDPKEFKPTETAIHPTTGDIYVADGYGKDYIFIYSPEGKLKSYFGGKGFAEAHVNNAHGVCLDFRNPKEPLVLVTSRPDNALKIYNLNGDYKRTVHLPGAYICRPVIKGDYLYFAVLINKLPWTSGTGFLLVLDKDFKVVSAPGALAPQYDKEGKLMPLQEDPALANVFIHPHDIAIDSDDNLYVTQWNSNKTHPLKLLRV